MGILLRWELYAVILAVALIIFFKYYKPPLLEECSNCGYPEKVGRLQKVAAGEYLCKWCAK